MSDSPSDAGDRETGPALRTGLRLSEAGIIAAARLDIAGDGSLKEALASATVTTKNGQTLPSAPLPVDGPRNAYHPPLTSEVAFDDQQPMLDLRFPEPPQPAPPTLPDDAQLTGPEPSAQPAAASAPAHQFDPPSPGQLQHLSSIDEPRAADVPMEVSPIFSALDAAEKSAEKTPFQITAPVHDAFESGILLPRSQLADDEGPEDGPADLQYAEVPHTAPAIVVETTLAADYAADAAALADADTHDPAEPLPPEGQPRPALSIDDASAKIAAEANATAEALENLKRLLGHSFPTPELGSRSTPPSADEEDFGEGMMPPPIPAFQPPVTPPPMIPATMAAALPMSMEDDMPRRRSGAAVGSFMAGFALSWVFGAVLYVYLTMA